MHVLLCIRNGQSKKHFYLLVQSHSLRSLISAHPFPAAALISLAEIWKKKRINTSLQIVNFILGNYLVKTNQIVLNNTVNCHFIIL